MTPEELKSLQAPLKDQYRSQPEAALATLKASGTVDLAQIAVHIDRPAGASCTPGLHPMAGGNGLFACAAEMLLESLIGCAGVTLGAVCTALTVPIRSARIAAEGDLDFRGTLGVDRETPVGFTRVHIHFAFDSDAPDATLDKATQLAERFCVVAQTLKAVSVSWSRA